MRIKLNPVELMVNIDHYKQTTLQGTCLRIEVRWGVLASATIIIELLTIPVHPVSVLTRIITKEVWQGLYRPGFDTQIVFDQTVFPPGTSL